VLVPVVIVRAVGVRLLATGIATTVVVVVAVLLGSSTLVAVMVVGPPAEAGAVHYVPRPGSDTTTAPGHSVRGATGRGGP